MLTKKKKKKTGTSENELIMSIRASFEGGNPAPSSLEKTLDTIAACVSLPGCYTPLSRTPVLVLATRTALKDAILAPSDMYSGT